MLGHTRCNTASSYWIRTLNQPSFAPGDARAGAGGIACVSLAALDDFRNWLIREAASMACF